MTPFHLGFYIFKRKAQLFRVLLFVGFSSTGRDLPSGGEFSLFSYSLRGPFCQQGFFSVVYCKQTLWVKQKMLKRREKTLHDWAAGRARGARSSIGGISCCKKKRNLPSAEKSVGDRISKISLLARWLHERQNSSQSKERINA